MRGLLAGLPFLLTLTAAEAQEAPYAPMAWLSGHCWQGSLPGGHDVDTHCFSWIYGDKFVRDRHTVHGAGHEDHLGETIYYWDAVARRLQYLYVESDGGHSQGDVTISGSTLIFPETRFEQNGQLQSYRSRWSPAADDAYDVVTEFRKKDSWVPGWTVHMQRIADAPTKP